jgi:hypothetical protein
MPVPALKVRVTLAAAMSTTETVPSPWFATSAVLPSAENPMPIGYAPTFTVRCGARRLAASKMPIVEPAIVSTNLPSGE